MIFKVQQKKFSGGPRYAFGLTEVISCQNRNHVSSVGLVNSSESSDEGQLVIIQLHCNLQALLKLRIDISPVFSCTAFPRPLFCVILPSYNTLSGLQKNKIFCCSF